MSTPPWGDPSRKAPPGRGRKNIGSLITPETSDETDPLFCVISACFRTASPDLRRLPLRPGRIVLPEAVRQLGAVISQKTTEILEQYNLLDDDDDETEIDVGMYGTYGQPDMCRPTVLLVTHWQCCE
ncbi:unnamed protein product [Fusarium langsethiae]|nr:unnamed protein product [Fusarium langsethiae]